MRRKRDKALSSIPAQFAQYSEMLAHQINEMWSRSTLILVIDLKQEHTETELSKSKMRWSTVALLEVMPHLLCGLVEPLRSDFVSNGLQSLENLDARDSFELALNKQATLHKGSKAAAAADVGFSNLVAMYFADPKLKPRSLDLHLRFKAFSPVLARQIADLNERANIEDGNPFTLIKTTLRRSILSLHQILPTLFSKLPPDTLRYFEAKGLDSLRHQNDAFLVEYTGMNAMISDGLKLEIKFDEALANLCTMHFCAEFVPFSHLKVEDTLIDISRAMTLSYVDFCDIKKLLEQAAKSFIKDEKKSLHTAIDQLNKSLNCTLKILNDILYLNPEKLTISQRLIQNSASVIEYIKREENRNSAFKVFLKNILPNVYGEQRRIELKSEETFYSFLRSVSLLLESEYRKYLSASKNPTNREISDKKSFGKYLHKHYESPEVSKIIEVLKDHGINGLAINNGEGFAILNDHIEKTIDNGKNLNRTPLSTALSLYNFSNKTELKIRQLAPYVVSFENENNGTVTTVNFYEIWKDYRKVFDDLVSYIDYMKYKTDEGAIQTITLHNIVTTFKTLLARYSSTLNSDDIKNLKEIGISAFGCNNNKLLEHFRHHISSDTKNNLTKSFSAIKQQNDLNSIISYFGIRKSDSFRVKVNKDQKLAQRRNEKSKYTLEEVIQIAYTIEKYLSHNDYNDFHHLCLLTARIFIKTGWNLTPVLELDRDDLCYFDVASLQGNRTAAVRLFKRRADYKTIWPTFSKKEDIQRIDADTLDDEYVTGKVTSGVIQDLEYISELTRPVSELNKNTNFRKRIFSYKIKNKTKVLTAQDFTDCINRLLIKSGVNIRFSVTKIRKSGLNYIYRKVAKNFERYKKAGLHTPQAFYQYYLKMEQGEAEASISAATSVMGDFLIRDNPERVIFVQKVDETTKQTPTGRCNQTTDSEVVKQFKAKNRKFIDEEKITGCADFGACLFCDHYRCVADAEHVWRLLSFEKVVIERMISASYSIYGDNNSPQQIHINELKKRVQNILKDLEQISFQAIAQGKDLFTQHGIHPDWEFT